MMECKKGHQLTKVPFSRGGFYCEICDPSYHEHNQKIKANRIAKMQLGKRNVKVLNLMNLVHKIEGGE